MRGRETARQREITEDAGKLRLQTVNARSDYFYSFCESDSILARCISMDSSFMFIISLNIRETTEVLRF